MPNATRKHAPRSYSGIHFQNWIFNGNKYVSERRAFILIGKVRLLAVLMMREPKQN